MPDVLTPTRDDPQVKEAEERLRESERKAKAARSAVSDCVTKKDELIERRADLKAQVEIGEADPSDVQQVEAELEEVKADLAAAKDDLVTHKRAADMLRRRVAHAEQEAATRRQRAVREQARAALGDLVDALEQADQAREELEEIRAFAVNRHNGVDTPAPVSNSWAAVGIQRANGKWRSLDQLKSRFNL